MSDFVTNLISLSCVAPHKYVQRDTCSTNRVWIVLFAFTDLFTKRAQIARLVLEVYLVPKAFRKVFKNMPLLEKWLVHAYHFYYFRASLERARVKTNMVMRKTTTFISPQISFDSQSAWHSVRNPTWGLCSRDAGSEWLYPIGLHLWTTKINSIIRLAQHLSLIHI